MTILGKVLAALLPGFMFAALGYMVVAMPMSPEGKASLSWLVWGLWLAAAAIAWIAPSAGKAWRRLLIGCGLLSLAIPLSTLLASAVAGAELSAVNGEPSGAAAAGAFIGAGAVTVFSGFVSLFLAAIFLIAGLLIGRDSPPR